MKISRFIQFLSLCTLLFGTTLQAGSLSRAINKVAPAATVEAQEPATELAADTTTAQPAPSVLDQADRIVSSTAVAAAPGAVQTSSRRQASFAGSQHETTVRPATVQQTAVQPSTTQPRVSPLRSAVGESTTPVAASERLAHKPAVAAPVSGKIIHPTYPPRTSVTASTETSNSMKPSATTPLPTLTAPVVASPTLVAPSDTGSKTTPLLTPPMAKSGDASTTESSSGEKSQLHNSLRDADGGHEPSLRGPNVTNAPALLAPPTGLRSSSDPQIVKPAELAAKPTQSATKTTSPSVTSAPETSPSPSATTPKQDAPVEARPHAIASDLGPRSQPVRTSDPSQAGRPNPLLGDEEDSGEKSVIGRAPADAKAKQLFESEEEVPLTPEMVQLKKRTQAALANYYQNWTLNTRDHSPWEVMHAIVAYGVDTRIRKGGPGGEPMTAIGHLCFSGICKNQPILTIRKGELYALRGPGVQGHSGQFLAILAQSYLQRDYPLYVGGKQFTLEDLIEAEKKDCEAGTELTFKLISLMHYLPSDATWTNFQGQEWSLDRLIREEIVQPIRGAACGGTHRLMGLSYAVRKREQREEPITGIYLEAQKYIDQYHKYTWSLQNPDGSFSTNWFVRKEARNDIDRRMQTTGHTLEWLAFSLSDEQLRDPRMVKAVKYTTDLLLNEDVSEWEIGHLGHALHALQIYNERVFGGPLRSFEGLVSRRPLKTAQRPTQGR